MDRQRVSSGSPFEATIGFSRAVRVGSSVFVSGTAPVAADGGVYAPGDLAAQTRRCLDIISQALADAGADLGSVVRTRVFLTDVTRWREAADVHGAFFGEVRPAASFIGCSALINPDWLVEVEAEALIS